MAALFVDPFHVQIALGFGLCALAFVSLLRPDLGLAVAGMGLLLIGATIYAEVGPTSPQLTTAAVCVVGGVLAAGLAGAIRQRGPGPVGARIQGSFEWRAESFDDLLALPTSGRDEGDFSDYLHGAERPEPRRLSAARVSSRTRAVPPATLLRETMRG